VDAYDDIQTTSGEIAKHWYMVLLATTVEQQQAGKDVKLKLIDVIRSSTGYTTSSHTIEIDG
jgi:hypothetical protein